MSERVQDYVVDYSVTKLEETARTFRRLGEAYENASEPQKSGTGISKQLFLVADVLEECITLSGISLKIIDTAGIRDTEDLVEQIGVDKAKEMGKEADLILYVVDSSVPLDENDEKIIEMMEGKQAIVLLNKTDLESVVEEEELKVKTGHFVLPISAKEETGIQDLVEKIKEMFFDGNITFNDEVYITNVRQKEALEEAYHSLELVEQSISMGMPEDFFSIDLMNAYEALGRILGESVGEDLVNEIFAEFCMGK